MKKIIPVKLQKRLIFIPFLNATVLFIWLYNYYRGVNDFRVFKKSLFVLFATTLPIAVLQIILTSAFSQYAGVVSLIDYLSIYCTPLSMAYGLVRFQTKIFET